MAPAIVCFDVWAKGPSQPPFDSAEKRSDLLRHIETLHLVAQREGAQFVAGGRLRVRSGIDAQAAQRLVAELEKIGVRGEVEPTEAPEEAILALDQFLEPEPDATAAPTIDESLLAKLATVDGEETQGPARPRLAPPPAKAADTDRMRAASSSAPDDADDARFRPSGHHLAPVDLQIDRPPPPSAQPPPSPPPSDGEAYPATDDDAPVHVEAPWQPIPGRIAQGALRKNPPLRIAIGVVAALALGYVLAQPYARRAERHAAELRAEADAERYRPVDEAQARVRQLDDEADDTSNRGALGTAVIWIVVGGAAFAGWWRAT
ncbi:MAG: hypothetical protein JWN44_7265 [Myxococcales bacterium]|nr:hypothetical protein [Myxococcales bacterium]